MENKQLVAVVEKNGLEALQGNFIINKFAPFAKEMMEAEEKAMQISVNDISQIKEMAEAREIRLRLKKTRGETEDVRVELKARAIKENKVIDGIATIIKDGISKIEEHLEKQEKFAENLEIERKAKVEAQRSFELQKYVEDITLYNFKDMSDEAFNNLVGTLKLAFEARQKATQEANEEIERQAKKEKEEAEKNKLEVERLKKEAETREKELAKERAEQEKKLEAERAKVKKEAEAREKIEAELKAKKDKEEKEKKEAEIKLQAERLAKLEAEKKAELAPDREKLVAYAVELGCLETPKLQTKEAKETLSKALNLLGQVIAILKN